MDDLIAFLNARLDEDEVVARKAAECAEVKDGRWFDGEDEINDDNGLRLATVNSPPVTVHCARHDPGRVLREVEAGRALVSGYERALVKAPGNTPLINTLIRLMRARAAVWCGHRDFRREWAGVDVPAR